VTETPNATDELAARIRHWLIGHPGRAAAARFPIDELWTLLDERREVREQLTAESLRADRAENARDQVGRMLHAAQERLAAARRLAGRIHGIAKHPSFAAPADLAQALHEHATQLLAVLGTGGGPGGAESDADGRTGPVASDAAPEPSREAQRGAEAVPLSVCGRHSKPGLGGILGPCIKAQGHPGAGDWHLDARGAAWDPNIDADASR
jgi:hypothetical protein